MRTLIIGGGLSGLALASALEADGHDYILVEARDRFGGRIMTERYGSGYYDMGPAWFWPGQPRIAALIANLELEKFDQYSIGIQMVEDERGQVHRGRGFASMQGSWRLKGGLDQLTHCLAERLPATRKRLNARVAKLAKTDDAITAKLIDSDTVSADRVVLALPPRVAARIDFVPSLPSDAMHAMQGIATWMAGHAKALAVYDRPIWREAGLSGDAVSHIGPMVEVHDASPAEGGPFALFGFVGVPPEGRTDGQVLRQNILAQLGHLFGPEASEPQKLYLKDWAFDPHTATDADAKPLYAHPTYGMPRAMTGLWDGKLHFAGTEVAPQFGGYIEGALEAAENVLKI
jgi:monoamine oxidase